jgi:hypothetical protein
MADMRSRLSSEGLLATIAASGAAATLLDVLQIQTVDTPLQPDRESGTVNLGVKERGLGAFDLNLKPPGADRKYVLTFDGPSGARTGFRLAVSLSEGLPQPLFKWVQGLPGHALKAASKHTSADAEWLEEVPNTEVQLAGANVVLVLKGTSGGAIGVSLSPNMEPPDDVVVLGLQPTSVLLGGTGFGLDIEHGIAFDDSASHKPPGTTRIDGVVVATPADTDAWRGIAVRAAKFYLPEGVPFLGGHAVEAHLEIGKAPTPGIDLIVQAKVPPKNGRPGIDVRIECRDPAATGLGSFVPTLVEAVMTLALDGRQEGFSGQTITFAAGKPVRVRARYARPPVAAGAAPKGELTLAVESQGPDGLLAISSDTGELGAKIAVTAAALATALIADGKVGKSTGPDGDASGVVLHAVLTAAVGLSSFLHSGNVVLHGAEIMTVGGLIPVGKSMRLKIDYSVAATVSGIDVGVLSVQMQPDQPLRVRVREVVLTIDPDKSGFEMIHLDYAKSSLEVEDPGGWKVQGPGSLFDVLGTRSGRGSMWIEVDLRFKLDLGPVKVTGATIRGELDAQGHLSGSLRGLAASIALKPMIDGEGAVQLTSNGFRAFLAAHIEPLDGLGARADVEVAGEMVKLGLGVDLPGPIPLGNTGLGLYGVGGVFAANGRPAPAPPGHADPIKYQLDWDYRDAGSFVPAPAFSFGLEAVIGTAPDMGFAFSARTGLFVTTPEIAVRGAVLGRFLGERVRITRDDPVLAGLQAKGVVVVDRADGVTVAIEGSYRIPRILEIVVPVAARFPRKSPDWYIHIGADGWTPPAGAKSEGREMGPARAVVLPGILDQTADAYLMFRGTGITAWPRGGKEAIATYTIGPGCYVGTFGFGFNFVMGLKPIVWAEVFARADILVSTHPMTFIGLGRVGGGLHVGLFSVGVDASVHVHIMENDDPYLYAEVCGKIDLLFDEIRKCVKIAINKEPIATIPEPGAHPLDSPQGQALVDDKYRVVERLAASRAAAMAGQPVWPDAMPLLAFTSAPILKVASTQFPSVNPYPQGDRARPLGNDLLRYDWELTGLVLVDCTDPKNEAVVAGSFSAAWLDGKFGNAGSQPEPAELALLTPNGDLWFDALADAGKSLPHDPLGARADICRRRREPLPGWAVGATASPAGSAYRLPPDALSADPIHSQVRATASLEFLATPLSPPFPLDAWNAQLLPPPYGFAPAAIRPFATPRPLSGRDFAGYLDLGGTLGLPGPTPSIGKRTGAQQQLRLDLDEPVRQASLWLALDALAWPGVDRAGAVLRVSDDLLQAWAPVEQVDVGGGRIAVRFAPPAANPVRTVLVRFAPSFALGVIAVGGVTASADAAAFAHNGAAANEAALLAQVKADSPPKANDPPSPTVRCVLAPNRVYRIDVTMRWSATMHRYDDQGNKLTIATRAADATTTSTRSYWYRTARLRDAATQISASGTYTYFDFIHARRDLFDPKMLARHLRGYEPAQSELHRFADDPVRVHFGVSHVAVLAKAYGFDLRCAIRRLDAPATEEPDLELAGKLVLPLDTQFMVGGEVERAKAYYGSACELPPPGAVLQAEVSLTRETWYEVYALAKSTQAGIAHGRLDGVSFRTSRWGGGPEMLAALQFRPVAPGKANGGVAIRAGAALTVSAIEGDDSKFDAFLDALGLDGWPVAAQPRVSLLWRETGAEWRCAGVLLESPEPIHRPGRFEVGAMRLRMGLAGAAVAFNIRRRDRSGSRLLFATSKPFRPVLTSAGVFGLQRPPLLQLEAVDMPIGKPPQSLAGLLQVPLAPSFAEEAA